MVRIVLVFISLVIGVNLKAQSVAVLSEDRLRPLDSLVIQALDNAPQLSRISKRKKKNGNIKSQNRKDFIHFTGNKKKSAARMPIKK